ncbi:hypothetical protein [Acinetobacter calcoaceticus]|uniref:hypothetical protein n=1 Tax=Acinetobacter calcoaceticus TaxID=471 RepID=UPI00192B036C|nr:hypothetical protein [Acinetobacter calcoaceticus]
MDRINFELSNIGDLIAIAEHVIGCRMALRSSGKLLEDNSFDSISLYQDIYQLDTREKLIDFIKFHSKKYRDERLIASRNL